MTTPLAHLLHERMSRTGGIPFVEFMAEALYHPQYGYYMGERQRIGRSGDFFTSSSVHPLFGLLIARQLRQMWELLDRPVPFVIAEQGAGEGHFCLDILTGARAEDPDFYNAIRYTLIDISPDNRNRQQVLLQPHSGQVSWGELAELQGMVGCFLSNELVDAFPVHLVEQRDGTLHEVFVVSQGDSFAEELRPPSTDALQRHLSWLGIELTEGCRAEVNLAAVDWMTAVAGVLGRGFVLTIDYGYQAAELYAPWRKSGTLMCYYRHTSSEDPYVRIGEQDITAHIDFTALARAGEAAGLQELYWGEQYRFLISLGFVDALIAAESRETDPKRAQALRLTLKNLIVPEGGMGETFKVLIQGKGVEAPNLLCRRPVRDLAAMLA